MTLDGETVAVVSLAADRVRPIGRREIALARGSPARAARGGRNFRYLLSGQG